LFAKWFDKRQDEVWYMASPMKKLFLTEFDGPVHLTIDGAGSDRQEDCSDNTHTWGYILKIASHFVPLTSFRDLRRDLR